MSHTPTPYHVGVREHHHCIYAPNGEMVCDASPFGKDDETKETAEFIVRACNSHDDLVAALSNLLNCVDGSHDPGWYARCRAESIAALAKAKS